MMPMRFKIIPYRKLQFAAQFGFSVRDLMMLQALARMPGVLSIDWLERPDTIHERILGGFRGPPTMEGVTYHSKLDLSLLGPLRERRSWARKSIGLHKAALCSAPTDDAINVILDFNPFFIPPAEALEGHFYWYDLIDNFVKHNRYSEADRNHVAAKYAWVNEHADLITGVSVDSVRSFDKGVVLANRIQRPDAAAASGVAEASHPEFDLGFVGFITDKFDHEFVTGLADRGLKVLVCGKAYDKTVTDILEAHPNVTYRGPYNAQQVNQLVQCFRIGLIPYRIDRLHDESPIKFFHYVTNGRAVMMSRHFNDIESRFADYVHYYDPGNVEDAAAFTRQIIADFPEVSRKVVAICSSTNEMYWEDSLHDIMAPLLAREGSAAHG
jgi:hypothetical protein